MNSRFLPPEPILCFWLALLPPTIPLISLKEVVAVVEKHTQVVHSALQSATSLLLKTMKIEFSSWETTDSTLHRRRKRPTNGEKNPSDDEPLPLLLAHSFVKSLRSRTSKKARTQALDDVIPLVVLTSETKVAVAGILKGEFIVSQTRQYPCPPGVSFFPDDDAPRIPAVLEKKNERMYALRNNNNQIVCWPSMSDDPTDLVSKSLAKDCALSLDVMPGRFSLVFGTLQGDRTQLFFASLDQGAQDINLRLFDLPGLPKGSESTLQHIATFGYERIFDDDLSVKSPAAGKRKATTMEAGKGNANEGMVIVQVLLHESTLYVARHEIVAEDPSDVSSFKRAVKVHGIPLNLHHQEDITVDFVGHAGDMVVLSCRTASGGQFLFSISAKTGKIASGPFNVRGKPQRFSLVDPQSVIAQIDDGVALIDLKSGAILQVVSLPKDIQSQNWKLLGMDPRKARVFVLLENDEAYSVASANVLFEEDSGSSKCLAARISQQIETRTGPSYQGPLLRRQSLQNRENGDGGYSMASTTRTAVEWLGAVCSMFESSLLDPKDNPVTSIFAEATESMARAEGVISQSTGRVGKAHQSDLHTKRGAKNGVLFINGSSRKGVDGKGRRHASATTSRGAKKDENFPNGLLFLNGSSSDVPVVNGGGKAPRAPASVPEGRQISENLQKIQPALVSFVGVSAIRILLIKRNIGSARNMGRSILRRVLRSNRASARYIFDSHGGFSLPDVLKALQKRSCEDKVAYSPVELLFDIFNHCKDASERHMVLGAQYMLQRATAEDQAGYFERTEPFCSVYKRLCHNYRTLAGTADLKSDPETKLLICGSEIFLASILAYSECNETLLRRSIAENLSRAEVPLFLKLVVRAARYTQKHHLEHAYIWTAALCERLQPLRSGSEIKLIQKLQASLSAERDATSALLSSVKDLLETSIQDISESSEDKTGLMQLPPYQLERLVF